MGFYVWLDVVVEETGEVLDSKYLGFVVSFCVRSGGGSDESRSGGSGGGETAIDWKALWQRWKDANPCEKNTAFSYPFAAFKIADLRDQADAWFADATKGRGPDAENFDNTYENAVQHCYFSCLATIHLGFSDC